MPEGGALERGEAMATIQRIAHERLTDERLGELLEAPAEEDAEIARVVRRDRDRAVRVPPELAADLARAGAEGAIAWQRARAEADFALFAPQLERNVELCRRYAACFPESEHPYDALLDRHEPEMTTQEVRVVFARLRDGLVPLIETLAARPSPPPPAGPFPAAEQRALALEMLRALGFEEDHWRLDKTVHPFLAAIGSSDVRVTTRFAEDSLAGIFGTLHEMGHGLYERQVDPALSRTTVGTGVSSGIHESQSRLWENLVGRGAPFWRYWLPRAQARFPTALGAISLDEFLRAVNAVRPSLIRVEADEATYSLHIILRFELELELIEGTLAVAELPEAWNARMRELLGVDVPDDVQGVLQDIHWAYAELGYFPTYALGNVIAAQLWRAARADLPALDDGLAAGDTAPLREWLREHVHRHGRLVPPAELLRRATGSPLDPQPLLDELASRYGALYPL
jgi:carboxypeptidase Taq